MAVDYLGNQVNAPAAKPKEHCGIFGILTGSQAPALRDRDILIELTITAGCLSRA
jgi:hypothetical protein